MVSEYEVSGIRGRVGLHKAKYAIRPIEGSEAGEPRDAVSEMMSLLMPVLCCVRYRSVIVWCHGFDADAVGLILCLYQRSPSPMSGFQAPRILDSAGVRWRLIASTASLRLDHLVWVSRSNADWLPAGILRRRNSVTCGIPRIFPSRGSLLCGGSQHSRPQAPPYRAVTGALPSPFEATGQCIESEL
ncbi:hypothetical protein BO78DRAFT_101493 [Aspergillus sclerotiicarbonarius CBS 121057]|uniref:Uncharacterized protein n=1 Tax=Aspergillus sclerotiicarbonarius (strain CBS 121057 / IBT 28362) TaxID=1448318 RepID=A0A319EVD8_ASPSB|nr:hypothetical protein BO78DRAFT_101493 [Aspergillus sclerotiicarbonarius CBS 121057]